MEGDFVKGQLSAEMIILVAVVLAVVAIVAISMTKTAEKSTRGVEDQSNKILNRTGEIVNNLSTKIPQKEIMISFMVAEQSTTSD